MPDSFIVRAVSACSKSFSETPQQPVQYISRDRWHPQRTSLLGAISSCNASPPNMYASYERSSMSIEKLTGQFMLLLLTVAHTLGQTLPAEQHPSLLFSSDEVPVMKERILREPYALWWQTVLDRADNVPSTFEVERTKARMAKSSAFAYLMTDDDSYAQQAVDLLLDMKFPPRGADLGEPHNEGEVVALYAVAYDMIHQYVSSDAAATNEIRTILAEEAQRLYDGIIIFELDLGFLGTQTIRLHETGHLDNWHVRAYGGLGLAAMALSDHPGLDDTPQEWADWAFEMVTSSLWFQIDPIDGGYAEGPFYSRYAADVYLPYMFALKNLSGVDLFVDPQIQKMHDWSLNLRMPSGRRPNIDDGHIDDFYGHYLSAAYPDGGIYRWDWENNINGPYTREFSEMDAIALFDDEVAAQEPASNPTVFMPEAGDAVFRSDWSADATYMLLRGEHGVARAQGLGHEHADETSFIIYAGGEMLALDAGYINFSNHNKVNRGRNHNVILVDGEGPPNTILDGESIGGGNDAFLEQTFATDFLDYAEVRAAYQGVDFRRNVMFADKTYFIIGDEVRDDETHTYEWRLHGHGGGDGGGTYQREGPLSRWAQENAELMAFVSGDLSMIFSERDTLHSFDHLQEPTHTMLQATQTTDDAEFLSILYPRRLSSPTPALSAVVGAGGKVVQMALQPLNDLAWLRDGVSTSVQFSGPAGAVESDGRFGFIRYEDERVAGFNVQDGSFLNSGEETIFDASEPIDASLGITPTQVNGYIRGPESGYDISLRLVGSVEGVTFSGIMLNMALKNEVLTLQLVGDGLLNMARDTAILSDATETPDAFQLAQNYPNPFNAQTTIAYKVEQNGHTRLEIYDLAGQQIRSLVDQVEKSGAHSVSWDGIDNSGQPVASGVYVYRLITERQRQAKKMILLK